MGYSRIPYAAALDGEYFAPFARVHPRLRIPHVSLLVLGANAMLFCLFKLADVVTALVVIRLVVQFLVQTLGVMVLRKRQPDLPRPFRMWLYPLPAVLAFLGFVYVLVMRPKSLESIALAGVVVVVGSILFAIRHWRRSAAA
jgi:basic amino acid/polyamine antiporter, APA family